MPSGYPAAIDNFNNPSASAGDNLNTPAVIHDLQHTNVNDAVEAIQTELGINPRGVAASVAARLTAIDAAIAARQLASEKGSANGLATLDGSSKLVQNVDATKVNSGTLGVDRIPNHSGAKILGTVGGGAAIPVDAVPNLPGERITSGTVNIARIPNFDASKVTSGVFDGARIPTTVTANANARVVADIAARDAILIASRINGMLVWVESTNQMFTWESAGSTWNLVGGGADVLVDISTWLTSGVTSFSAGSYPVRGWYNNSTKRFTLEAVLTRTSNSAAGILHPVIAIPALYQPVGGLNVTGSVPNTIGGGAEKVSRFTGATTMSVIVPATVTWAVGQFAMCNATWIVA